MTGRAQGHALGTSMAIGSIGFDRPLGFNLADKTPPSVTDDLHLRFRFKNTKVWAPHFGNDANHHLATAADFGRRGQYDRLVLLGLVKLILLVG